MTQNSSQELIAKLSDPNCPSRAAIQVDAGAGVYGTIERIIAHFASSTSVLLLAPNFQVLVEQWASRLGAREDITVQTLSVSLALDWLDRGVPGRGSVIVGKLMDLRRPPIQRLLQSWVPGALIVDDASAETRANLREANGDSHAATQLRSAMSSSPRTIVVTRSRSVDGMPIVARIRPPERSGHELNRYEFSVSSNELELMKTAGLFTQQNGVKSWHDVPDTRPALMDRLLRIATAKSGADAPANGDVAATDVAEVSWGYIDALERLVPDPRLEALDRAIDECDSQYILVVAPRVADVDYVVQHLESTRGDRIKIVSNKLRGPSFEPGLATGLFAGTPSALRQLTLLSGSVALIVWSREVDVLDQLSELIQGYGKDIFIAVLIPTPEPRLA
jgi:hypothetical protein